MKRKAVRIAKKSSSNSGQSREFIHLPLLRVKQKAKDQARRL
jgi:hypothetical protein